MTGRNQSLDLLRGLAVLLMVAVHCSHVATSIVPDLRSMVMQYGELGVQLFFIVSGYTMMLTFGDKVDVAGASSLYLRRVFRIVPLAFSHRRRTGRKPSRRSPRLAEGLLRRAGRRGGIC